MWWQANKVHVSNVVIILAVFVTGVSSKSFTITNNCGYTVWPGILSSSGSPPLESTGFVLAPGESRTLPAPHGWSGRLWGRTLCATDAAGKFSCATGNCGSGQLECAGHGATPPATLAEFTLDGHGEMDFYDASLVDGYNLPMLVAPRPHGVAAGGNCVPTGCMVDLNGACPAELQAHGGKACKSACEAFGSPEHCCHGEYGNPNTCKPSQYSQFFKNACPRAYSYAYDDATSTFTCGGGHTSYDITFCPGTSSMKSAGYNQHVSVYIGGKQVGSSSSRAAPRHSLGLVVLGGALVALAGVF
ncbi:hypothetical protein ACP70R_015625 [Stipagrostis hirtigluma subsp. patula]